MRISNPSFERNRDPILDVLKKVLPATAKSLLEVGSGSGLHAAYFASQFPQLRWVTSDVSENHSVIKSVLEESGQQNVEGPIAFEVGADDFPQGDFDVVFSANTFHIMAEGHVRKLIELFGAHLKSDTAVLIYGPFNYNGKYTSESNAEFDQWLKSVDSRRGIRNFEDVVGWMSQQGFHLVQDIAMPSNNRILYFKN